MWRGGHLDEGLYPLTDRSRLAPKLMALCSTCIALLVPAQLASQAVAGRLVEQDTRRGVEGAIVWLIDEGGRPVTRGLTDGAGGFRLHSSESGTFHLKSERIGFADSASDVFELGRGQTIEVVLEASTAAVLLSGLLVTSDSRCDLEYDSGEPTDRLWREARKALTAAVLTGSSRPYRFSIRRYSHDLRPQLMSVSRVDDMSTFSATHGNPIRSRPVTDLQSRGYVQTDELGVSRYYGPDAEVLLSDEFLEGHCFRVVREPASRPHLVGLWFAPTPGIDRPDVIGTLWLDEQTAEVRFLEYRYSDLPEVVGDAPVGGRIDFERLPAGSWIVRKWFIRMPHMTRMENDRGRFVGLAVTGIKEMGGEILEIREFDPNPLDLSMRTTVAPNSSISAPTVAGTVVDHVSGLPLQRTDVALVAPDDRVVGRDSSEVNGRFSIPLPDAGSYRLRATRVGYASSHTDSFTLADGQEAMVELRLSVSPALWDSLGAGVEGQNRTLMREGFYRREAIGFGAVRTPLELEDTPPGDAAELFSEMNGVEVTGRSGTGPFDVFSTRGPELRTCRPVVAIDRVVVQTGGHESSGWQSDFDAGAVGAIEVYPAQGGLPRWLAVSSAPCGGVVIWTKSHIR